MISVLSVFSAEVRGDVPMPEVIIKAGTDEKLLSIEVYSSIILKMTRSCCQMSIEVSTSIVLKKLPQLRVNKSVVSDEYH